MSVISYSDYSNILSKKYFTLLSMIEFVSISFFIMAVGIFLMGLGIYKESKK